MDLEERLRLLRGRLLSVLRLVDETRTRLNAIERVFRELDVSKRDRARKGVRRV